MNHLINNTMKLAHVLKAARKNLGWSQADAAEQSGLLPKTISLLENNPGKSGVETLLKYLSALKLELLLTEYEGNVMEETQVEW